MIMFILNIILWIPGHSKNSILNLMAKNGTPIKEYMEPEINDEESIRKIKNRKSSTKKKVVFREPGDV